MSNRGPNVSVNVSQAGVEPDLLPLGRLFIWIGVLLAIIIGVVAVLWQVFVVAADTEIEQKELTQPNSELLESRARDEKLIGSYEQLDRREGIYRIPLERAVELLAKEPALLGPLVDPTKPPAKTATTGSSKAGPIALPGTNAQGPANAQKQ